MSNLSQNHEEMIHFCENSWACVLELEVVVWRVLGREEENVCAQNCSRCYSLQQQSCGCCCYEAHFHYDQTVVHFGVICQSKESSTPPMCTAIRSTPLSDFGKPSITQRKIKACYETLQNITKAVSSHKGQSTVTLHLGKNGQCPDGSDISNNSAVS